MKWSLKRKSSTYRLADGLTLIGRLRANDIKIKGTAPIHSAIFVHGNIVKLEARAEVYVNKCPVQRLQLISGDVIQIRAKNQKTTFIVQATHHSWT